MYTSGLQTGMFINQYYLRIQDIRSWDAILLHTTKGEENCLFADIYMVGIECL